MSLRIYNVLTRQKEEFIPLSPGKVSLYVCGPTVYDDSHIGHAKTYVNFDVVARYLRFSGYDVLYVQNLTDVGHILETGEDRVMKTARKLSAKPMQIVETYTRGYFADMDALGVQRPDISPRASAHIPEQIAMIEQLLEKENAYIVDGSVYFDVSSIPDYGKLSGRIVEDLEEGARVAVREEKNHPADFALWKKAAPEHIMRWPSPWGEGFPGWHIECSAMAAKYLGPSFDIHGGGIDNIFPHNECEIAQSEAAHDTTFAQYWMLVGSLTLDGIKMSKSLGNTMTIKDALDRWQPETIRTFMLSSHYSNPIDFSVEAIEAAHKGWQRIWGAVRLTRAQLEHAAEGDPDPQIQATLDETRQRFIDKMDDDFNAPASLAVLQDLTRQVNTWLNSSVPQTAGTLTAIDQLYRQLGGDVLGIIPDHQDDSASAEREDDLVNLLIELRNQARKNSDWATADQIRDQLKELGILLEDRSDGTIWKLN